MNNKLLFKSVFFSQHAQSYQNIGGESRCNATSNLLRKARLWAGAKALFLFSSFFIIFAEKLYALPSDNKEKLYITAQDNSIYNFKTGVKIIRGNVQIDQGTTHLTAAKVILRDNANHQVGEVIAYGGKEKAHYWTLTKKEDPELHAFAFIIKYYPLAANVVLKKEAKVLQGKNYFQGELILYDMNKEVVNVPSMGKSRVLLVYYPK